MGSRPDSSFKVKRWQARLYGSHKTKLMMGINKLKGVNNVVNKISMGNGDANQPYSKFCAMIGEDIN